MSPFWVLSAIMLGNMASFHRWKPIRHSRQRSEDSFRSLSRSYEEKSSTTRPDVWFNSDPETITYSENVHPIIRRASSYQSVSHDDRSENETDVGNFQKAHNRSISCDPDGDLITVLRKLSECSETNLSNDMPDTGIHPHGNFHPPSTESSLDNSLDNSLENLLDISRSNENILLLSADNISIISDIPRHASLERTHDNDVFSKENSDPNVRSPSLSKIRRSRYRSAPLHQIEEAEPARHSKHIVSQIFKKRLWGSVSDIDRLKVERKSAESSPSITPMSSVATTPSITPIGSPAMQPKQQTVVSSGKRGSVKDAAKKIDMMVSQQRDGKNKKTGAGASRISYNFANERMSYLRPDHGGSIKSGHGGSIKSDHGGNIKSDDGGSIKSRPGRSMSVETCNKKIDKKEKHRKRSQPIFGVHDTKNNTEFKAGSPTTLNKIDGVLGMKEKNKVKKIKKKKKGHLEEDSGFNSDSVMVTKASKKLVRSRAPFLYKDCLFQAYECSLWI